MEYFKILSALSLPLGVIILLLLICRSLVLWYFKIPDMIERQDKLIKVMEKQNALIEKLSRGSGESADTEAEKDRAKPTFTELRYGKI